MAQSEYIRKEHKEKQWQKFWTSGFYVSTVGLHGNEETIAEYVRAQRKQEEYRKILGQQTTIFD